MLTNFRYAIRQLSKTPGFTTTAGLTVALGVGATTAIFTLVHAMLLQSLPVKDPGALWRVGDNEQCCVDGGLPTYNNKPGDWSLFSYEQYKQFRSGTKGFDGLAAFQAGNPQFAVRKAGAGELARPTRVEYVSGNSFDVLGIRAAAGRLFRDSDDRPGGPALTVISNNLWRQRFGADPGIIGSSLMVNGRPVTVIGVAPAGFYGEHLNTNPPQLWLTINEMPVLEPERGLLEHTEQQWLNLIGRLQPGANPSAIEAQMNLELRHFLESPLAKLTPEAAPLIPKQYLRLTPGGRGVRDMGDSSGHSAEDDLRMLMWISILVLAIACANVANLMLVRAVGQGQQMAVRTALGAGRRHLIAGALTESIVLGLGGALIAVPLGWAGSMLLMRLAFGSKVLPNISSAPEWPVLLFAFGVAALAGLMFGIAPSWVAAHVDPADSLRGAARVTGRQTTLAQKILVVAQAALSVVLLCGAGFLLMSFRSLQQQHLGFETAHRYIFNIDPASAGYKPEAVDHFYRELESVLRQLPGVQNVAFSLYTPLEGDNWGEGVFIEGQPKPQPGSGSNSASWDRVTPGYFDAIGTKLVEGRLLLPSDDAGRRPVAVVNRMFVKNILHNGPAIGRHFGDFYPDITDTYEIVGVVDDAQYWGPHEPIRPMYFVAAAQPTCVPSTVARAADYAHFIAASRNLTSVTIQTSGPVPTLEASAASALAKINPDLPIVRFQSFSDQVRNAFSQQTMLCSLTSIFAALALILAAIGLYGVTAYAVAQRRTEIGIRMALGADKVAVHGLVLRGAFAQIGVGLLIGIPGAIAAGTLMESQLFGITAHNPVVLVTATGVLCLAALAAAVIPAARAAGLQPTDALRTE